MHILYSHEYIFSSKVIRTCNILGLILTKGMEVASPLVGEKLIPLLEEDLVLSGWDLGHITALATTTLQQTEYLFAGADDGKLYQVLLHYVNIIVIIVIWYALHIHLCMQLICNRYAYQFVIILTSGLLFELCVNTLHAWLQS